MFLTMAPRVTQNDRRRVCFDPATDWDRVENDQEKRRWRRRIEKERRKEEQETNALARQRCAYFHESTIIVGMSSLFSCYFFWSDARSVLDMMIYDGETAFEWLNHSASFRGAAISFFNALLAEKVAMFTPMALHNDPQFESLLRHNLGVLVHEVHQGRVTVDQVLQTDGVVFTLWPVYTLMEEDGGFIGDKLRRPRKVAI